MKSLRSTKGERSARMLLRWFGLVADALAEPCTSMMGLFPRSSWGLTGSRRRLGPAYHPSLSVSPPPNPFFTQRTTRRNHLSPNKQYPPICRPGQRKRLPTNIKPTHACLGPYVPEPNRTICRTARQLRIPHRVEHDLLNARAMASQLRRVPCVRALRVPDPDRTVGGASGDELACGVPC